LHIFPLQLFCCCLQVEEFELPKASTVCSFVVLSYFMVTAGIAYDIINEPPAIGAVQDEATGAASCLQECHQQEDQGVV
jgi:hypothetical protein